MPDYKSRRTKTRTCKRTSLYTEICPEFKNTYVEEVYNLINKRFKIGRVRFLMKPHKNMFVLA